jgi:hypothetical protein
MDKEQLRSLIKGYNKFIEDLSFEKDVAKDDYSKEESEWAEKPLEELGGKTPAQLAKEIEDDCSEEEIKELYRFATDNSYWSIPGFIKNIMQNVPEATQACLSEILDDGERFIKEGAVEKLEEKEIADFECFVTTLRLAPDFGFEKIDNRIIELFRGSSENEEVLDAFQTSFCKMDVSKIIPILSDFDLSDEKLSIPAQAIIETGKKSDEIFYALKKLLRERDTGTLFAMILTDYGDGRIVPLMRKQLKKISDTYYLMGPDDKNREDVYRLMIYYNNMIRTLGGQTDDIMG